METMHVLSSESRQPKPVCTVVCRFFISNLSNLLRINFYVHPTGRNSNCLFPLINHEARHQRSILRSQQTKNKWRILAINPKAKASVGISCEPKGIGDSTDGSTNDQTFILYQRNSPHFCIMLIISPSLRTGIS